MSHSKGVAPRMSGGSAGMVEKGDWTETEWNGYSRELTKATAYGAMAGSVSVR